VSRRIVLLLLGVTLPARAAPTLTPRLRMMLRGELRPAALASGADDRALVTLRARADALGRLGLMATSLGNDLYAARLSAGDLSRLAAAEGVSSIEERRLLYPLLDHSGPAIRAPEARAQSGLDGHSVLIGIVDTGIDWRHADLRGADGRTRIAALLDLATPPDRRHPELPDYGGAVYLRDEIDEALAAEVMGMSPPVPIGERDANGHGTHVAGIAASGGRATGRGLPAGRYVGVAPAADLVVVQASHGGETFTDTDVLTACTFILDRAAAERRPVVINLSLGGSGGAHDGTTHLEQALDDLVPPDAIGRALVVAAGNAGTHDFHAGGWQLDGAVEAPLDLVQGTAAGQLVIELWTDGAPDLFVVTPHGQVVGPVVAGNSTDATTPDGRVLVDYRGLPRDDGRRTVGVVLTGDTGPSGGAWRVRLRGRATRWDAWLVDQGGGGPAARFTDHVTEDDRLEIPATARHPITVGSFVSRADWTTVDGKPIQRMISIGAPSSFSSTGPTADGRFAPDLLAPGEFIASALSADATPDQPTSAFYAGASSPTFGWADDGVHGLLRGTSQAAPHVAGAIALLFQADPGLTAGQVREIMRATARGDGYTPRLGFGMLDVAAAVAYATGRRGGALSAARSSVGVSRDLLPPDSDETTVITVTPRDDDGAPLGPGHAVAIALTAGAPTGPVRDLKGGRYERTFAAHASAGQVGEAQVTVDGVGLDRHPTVFFVADRVQVGRPFAAGGGCAAPGPSPHSGPALVLLLALALLRRWIRR
jgi:subtilisin family serine protease